MADGRTGIHPEAAMAMCGMIGGEGGNPGPAARAFPARGGRAVASLALGILAIACLLCASCVSRTTSRRPSFAESARPGSFEADDSGYINSSKTIWIWQPEFWDK